ncbi:uncharacterized protein [Montipora capricornis]|uniref:uncharacterized protein isoform X2 n=1 Tax=Montipora capricornis TaxID=246305 RepID=UPI0035F1B1E7
MIGALIVFFAFSFKLSDCASIEWKVPPPTQTISKPAVGDAEEHLSRTSLLEGTINASLSWQFTLSSDLTFHGLALKFNDTPIAGEFQIEDNFRDKYAINWIPSERITLIIFHVTTEVNGIFACEVGAQSPQGGLVTFKSKNQVDVIAPPSNIVTSGNQTVTAPDELTLSCSADGKPRVNIAWIRLSDNTAVENLNPFNVTGKKEAGQYRCTADNSVGTLTSDVFITVLFAPVVTLASKFYVGREQNASLICTVEGNPTPSIDWRPCDSQNMECDKQHLNVSKVQTSRTNYTCAATNSLGNVSQTTVLIIGGKSVFLRIIISGDCDKKYDVWTRLQTEMAEVFKNTGTNYAGIELIAVRCGSLIFDLVLMFSTDVAEDDIISTLKRAVSDKKFEDLRINASSIIGIPPAVKTTSTPSTKTTPTSTSTKGVLGHKTDLQEGDNTLIIVGAVLGAVALVVIIAVIVWCVRKKKCPNETKEVSDGNASGQGRGGGAQGQNGGDESAYESAYSNASVLPPSKKPTNTGKEDAGQAVALPVYAQVDKSKKKPRSEREAQRQPGELLYVQADHSNEGSLPAKASGNPSRPPPYQDTVYADLV